MGVFFYNIFLLLFRGGTRLAALFNGKARKWVYGRKNILQLLETTIPKGEPIIWMHCASLGEFEQGRPVLERLKETGTGHRILLTFFSPSGYEVRKDYKGVDWVFYLPMDGPRTAKKFLEIVEPDLVIFVKYEFWYYYLKKIKYRNIPLLLVAALFRKDMSFFKWYGGLQRKILSRFDHIFVQNQASKNLLDRIGLGTICSISGDTRFDRVSEIAGTFQPLPVVEQFIGSNKVLVAGSTWPEDEQVLQKAFTLINEPSLKLIIAPHEINDKHLSELSELFPDSTRYSQLAVTGMSSKGRASRVLIMDNMGMLSSLYKYASITYVGGGLKPKGVHNVLEAAVYNKVVLFGPWYHKYQEAVGLVLCGGGLSFFDEKKDGLMLSQLVMALIHDKEEYNFRCRAAGEFIRSNTGATEKVIGYIRDKKYLVK